MSTNCNNLLRAVKQGDFKKALSLISQFEPSTVQAVETMICICNACMHPSANDKFTREELSTLLSIAISYTTAPCDREVERFLSSAYHILHYLIKVKELDLILEVKETWSPSFITVNMPPKFIKIYKSQCLLFCGNFVTMLGSLDEKRSADFSNLLVSMIDKLPPDMLFSKDLNEYVKYFLKTVRNETTLSILSEYMLRKYLTLGGHEAKILELFSYMIVSSKFPANLRRKAISIYEETVGNISTKYDLTFYTLKTVLESGISIKSLNLIDKSMHFIDQLDNKFVYLHILEQIFIDFYFKKSYRDVCDLFTYDLIELIYTVLSPISDTLATEKKTCQYCKTCKLIYNTPAQVGALLIIMGLFKECILINPEVPETAFDMFVGLYGRIKSLIDVLRKENCRYWEHYSIELITTMYNVAIYINRKKDYHRYTLDTCEIVVKEYLLLETIIPAIKLIDYEHIHSTLCLIISSYRALGESKKAMSVAAFTILRCNEALGCPCKSQWIQLKTSNKGDLAIKKLTMASLLSDLEFSGFKVKLSKEEISHILFKELLIYSMLWQSKIPLAECCEQIYHLNQPLKTAKALSIAWYDIPESILSETFHIILNVIGEVKDLQTSNREKFCIAKVYFLQYHVHIKTLEVDIRNQISKEPQESKDYENYRHGLEVPDNKWDCTTYEQLKIENLRQIKAPLLKSRKMVEHATSSMDVEQLKLLLDEEKIFKHIMELAFTFLLHGDKIEYLKTLFLCKNVAQLTDTVDAMVTAVGWIIREIDVNSLSTLLEETKPHLHKAEIGVTVEFYTNLSMGYFNNGLVEMATSKYLFAKDFYKLMRVPNEILSLELSFLEWNLLGLPCGHTIDDSHYQDFILRSSCLCSQLQERDYCSSRVKLMLSQYLMHTYVRYNHLLKSPREGRSGAKTMVQLCQRYILPLRFAETFTYLGDMDLLCEKLDDCQAKVSGLSTLLDVSAVNDRHNRSANSSMNFLIDTLQEMTLNAKQLKMTSAANSASPELCRDIFKYPHFLSHDTKCVCFYCMSLDYQKLVLTHVTLKGNLWAARNEPNTADYFYNCALQVYHNIINNKDGYERKIRNLLNIDTFWNIKDVFAECYANLLYNQGKIFVGTKRYNKISDELLKTVEKIKFTNPFLYNEAYFQRVTHFSSMQQTSLQHLSPILDRRSPSPVKTPENLITTLKVTTSLSPIPVRTFRVKAIKIDLSGDEDESKNSREGGFTEKLRIAQKELSQARNENIPSTSRAVPKNPTKTSKVTVYAEKEKSKTKENVEKHEAVSANRLTNTKTKSSKSTSPVPNLLVTAPSQDDDLPKEQPGCRRSTRNKSKKPLKSHKSQLQ